MFLDVFEERQWGLVLTGMVKLQENAGVALSKGEWGGRRVTPQARSPPLSLRSCQVIHFVRPQWLQGCSRLDRV